MVVLSGPDTSDLILEPTVAMDPADPDRIVVVAQYGTGYNRGGLRFWAWSSGDGGASWAGSEAVPRILENAPTMAADATLSFDTSGGVLLAGLYGEGVWEGTGVPRAAIALAVSEDGGRHFRPLDLFGEELRISPTHFVGSDKPWMATDVGPGSPFGGTLYVVWSRVTVRLDAGPPSVSRDLMLSFTRDGGAASTPHALAAGAHGGQVAVRPDGTVDVIWMEEDGGAGFGARILHVSSSDGGATFSTPVRVVSLPDSTEVLGLVSLASNAAGRVMACWSRSRATSNPESGLWCGRAMDDGSWTEPLHLGGGGRVIEGFPALVGTAQGWGLLSYQSDPSGTRVLLRRLDALGRPRATHTLGEVELPADRFCPASSLACRRNPDVFFPGDYVGISASGGRLAAVYILPRLGDPSRGSEVRVSVVR